MGSEGRETGSDAAAKVESVKIIGHKINYNDSNINTLWLSESQRPSVSHRHTTN